MNTIDAMLAHASATRRAACAGKVPVQHLLKEADCAEEWAAYGLAALRHAGFAAIDMVENSSGGFVAATFVAAVQRFALTYAATRADRALLIRAGFNSKQATSLVGWAEPVLRLDPDAEPPPTTRRVIPQA